MSSVISKILNIGVDSSINSELVQRIRFTNIIALVGFVVTIIVGSYGIWIQWPLAVLAAIWPILIFITIAFLLNHRKKNVAARMVILCLYNYAILEYSIIFGQELHYQYWSVPVIYATFLFFGNENKKLAWLMVVVNIIVFAYLQWHFTIFEPFVTMEAFISNVLRIVNNSILFIACLIIYYFFVSENNTYENTMVLKSEDLKENNKHLEHFAYIAAHDLNEPLRTVDSFIDIIKEEYFQEKDTAQETYFDHIQRSMFRMRDMIDGLLTYSRIGQSGKIEYKDINELIQNIQIDLTEVIKEKKAIVKSKKLPKLYCRGMEIRQLFQNLITNAIKFQLPGATPLIEISCIDKKTHWEFCCTDNGIGIAPRHLKNIFQIFKKLHLKTEYAGQGIGLAFCKKIVEIHDGDIWVHSMQGKGSQFYFTISKNIT